MVGTLQYSRCTTPGLCGLIAGRPRLVTSSYETGRRARKRRKLERKLWRRARIIHFLLEFGGVQAMRQMLVALERKLPSWLTPGGDFRRDGRGCVADIGPDPAIKPATMESTRGCPAGSLALRQQSYRRIQSR